MILSTIFVYLIFDSPKGLILNLLLKSQEALGKYWKVHASVSKSAK